MPPKGKKKDEKKKSLVIEEIAKPAVEIELDDMHNESSREYSGNIEEEYERLPELVLSRTSLLLLDYRQFKAARTIQTAFRGWFARHMYWKKTHSAIIIQREWRRFYCQRNYFRILEATVQRKIEEHYYRAAQTIQKIWRGWWVRENVHDQYRLSRMQVHAAEDLLQCVAFKLHHLLRTYQIPGIFSLRNSHCLSKVEQLLATISFKEHNDRVRMARAKREAQINEAKNKFTNSAYKTRIPYSGPDFLGSCEPVCPSLQRDSDADRKMFKILSLYERASRVDPRVSKAKRSKSEKMLAEKLKRIEKKSNFCDDVVRSMKRWNILAKNRVSIDPHVFRNPHNVEKFLTEVQSLYSLMQEQCNCNVNAERLQEIEFLK